MFGHFVESRRQNRWIAEQLKINSLSNNPTEWSKNTQTADESFQCVWPFCGIGVKRVNVLLYFLSSCITKMMIWIILPLLFRRIHTKCPRNKVHVSRLQHAQVITWVFMFLMSYIPSPNLQHIPNCEKAKSNKANNNNRWYCVSQKWTFIRANARLFKGNYVF